MPSSQRRKLTRLLQTSNPSALNATLFETTMTTELSVSPLHRSPIPYERWSLHLPDCPRAYDIVLNVEYHADEQVHNLIYVDEWHYNYSLRTCASGFFPPSFHILIPPQSDAGHLFYDGRQETIVTAPRVLCRPLTPTPLSRCPAAISWPERPLLSTSLVPRGVKPGLINAQR